jgi:translation initiation factor IF-3
LNGPIQKIVKYAPAFSHYEQHREQREQREHQEYIKIQNEHQKQFEMT